MCAGPHQLYHRPRPPLQCGRPAQQVRNEQLVVPLGTPLVPLAVLPTMPGYALLLCGCRLRGGAAPCPADPDAVAAHSCAALRRRPNALHSNYDASTVAWPEGWPGGSSITCECGFSDEFNKYYWRRVLQGRAGCTCRRALHLQRRCATSNGIRHSRAAGHAHCLGTCSAAALELEGAFCRAQCRALSVACAAAGTTWAMMLPSPSRPGCERPLFSGAACCACCAHCCPTAPCHDEPRPRIGCAGAATPPAPPLLPDSQELPGQRHGG